MRFKTIFGTFIYIIYASFAFAQSANEKLIGYWLSEAKDLKVQVYEANGKVYGRLVWFSCNHQIKLPLEQHFDTKNPNKKLRTRSWLNLPVLSNLEKKSDFTWENGKIYDANTGRVYSATVYLKSPTKMVVRGFYGIELLGKSMVFYKVSNSTLSH
jgi:uncharacterized protein (DUF2147 family)